jgi:hypothetical protein
MHIVKKYTLLYQPMSPSEWNSSEMTGTAVATTVLSFKRRKEE